MDNQQWIEDGWFYHNHAWHLLHEFLKLIREVNDPHDNITMLDFGGGTGLAAAVMRSVFPNIYTYVTDISNNCESFWEKRKITGFIDLLNHKTFKNMSFDIIMSSHVMEHLTVEQFNITIEKLFNAAKKRIIIAVPDGDVHFDDHKIIFNRSILEEMIKQSLSEYEYNYKSFPVYHQHMNNLIAVIDK